MASNESPTPQGAQDAPKRRLTIAVDAMGGDHAPAEVVKGAVEAARRLGVQVLLVGDGEPVQRELERLDTAGLAVQLVPSEGKVGDDEHPAVALRQKPRASVLVATHLVKEGKADALVTMGSTGAAMASSTILLGTLEGMDRPALGGPFLGLAPNTVVLDLGSSVDCRPGQLLGFAILGCVFARRVLGVENPRVALLSVGAEETKGNRQVRESLPLFRESGLNFVGNVEGHDLFTRKADVIICDGFVGNIVMKFSEGMGVALVNLLQGRLKDRLSPQEMEALMSQLWEVTHGTRRGGPLFGINGVVIVGHGASQAQDVAGAIEMAQRVV
ncbi:MAG: phosphate acyltransferase PlsX, partial [Dehalococcoidia bacterium]